MHFVFQRENAVAKHQSSSIEDLMLLFETERECVKCLIKARDKLEKNDTTLKLIDNYLDLIDYDM